MKVSKSPIAWACAADRPPSDLRVAPRSNPLLRRSAFALLAGCAVATPSFAADGLHLAPVLDAIDVPMEAGATAAAPVVILYCIPAALIGCMLAFTAMWLRERRSWRRHASDLARAGRRFDQLAAQTSDAVLRLDRNAISITSSAESLLGYSATELADIDVATLVHPDDRAKCRLAHRALGTDRRRIDLTCRLIHRDGTTIWAETCFLLIEGEDGTPQKMCAVRDVTQRRTEADALRLASQTAHEAECAAEKANKAKDEFLASMSHEIRTPLNAIIGFADLMLAMEDLAGPVRQHVERIRGGGDALLTVVNDILDLSEAAAGKLRIEPRPFALQLLVDECLALVEPAALAKDLALRVELADRFPAGLMGDDRRLRQVLLNLLNNAIKFTQRGQISLRIAYDRRTGADALRFEVVDTGIGIAADDIQHLFQRFRQVDGTIRRTYGGTGLGLAISKTIIEAMGGAIGVRSEKGVGSTFWFTLAMAPAYLALERPATIKRTQNQALTILLVEDVPINQELACALLKAKGHKVDVVSDGGDAIMAVQHTPYDLVLMDVQMPHVDGITATRAIRNLGAFCRFVPIVAMTAAVLEDQLAQARAAGMDDVLAKPISLPALEALLEKAERDAIRVKPDPTAFDEAAVATLRDAAGDTKIAAMRALLAKTLTERFTTDCSIDTLAALKAEAHASIAGAAMLGFPRFSRLCRTFVDAESSEAAAAHAALRAELYHVVRNISDIATQPKTRAA